MDGPEVPLYGEGANVRDWLFVADHCRGIQLVVEQGAAGRVLQHRRRPRAVQQGADRAAARGDRARLVLRRADRRSARRRPRPALLGRLPQDRPSSATPRRCRSRTGWPRPSQWYRDNRAWWEPLKAEADAGADIEHGPGTDGTDDRALADHRRARPARHRPACSAGRATRRPTPVRRSAADRASTSPTRPRCDAGASRDFAARRDRQRGRLHRGRRGRDRRGRRLRGQRRRPGSAGRGGRGGTAAG